MSAYRRALVNRCKSMVGSYPRWRQCKRLKGHGVDGKWCKQHAAIVNRMILRAWGKREARR